MSSSSPLEASIAAHPAMRMRTSLRTATEVFVSSPWHTRTDVLVFEELALHLLRHASAEERRASAKLLVGHANAPAAVMRAYLGEEMSIASVVFQSAYAIPEIDLLALVANGSREHRLAIARRPRLPAQVVEALARVGEEDVLLALADNAATVIEPGAEALLAAWGRADPLLARRIGRRPDVRDETLLDLFLVLDAAGRRRALQALELKALKHLVKNRLLVSPPALERDDVGRLVEAAGSQDEARYGDALADLLEVPSEIGRALVADQGGEALLLALKGAGASADLITRLLLMHAPGAPRDYFELKRLAGILDQVSIRAAMLLVDGWRSARPVAARAGLSPINVARRDLHREMPVRREAEPAREAEPIRQSG